MAEPVKRGDKYRHIFMVNGSRYSGSFKTKREARNWEYDIRAKHKSGSPDELAKIQPKHSLSSACDKYLESITPMKRGATLWETRRFNYLLEHFPGRNIEDITSADVAKWRDSMLKSVTGSTINRYWNLYSNLFTIASKEWGWIKVNPFSAVKRPAENPARQTVWKWQQIRRVLREGQRRGGKTGEAVSAFHIALDTSLRLNEALAAPTAYSNESMVISLPSSKVSRALEKIPTTARGRRVLRRVKPFSVEANEASTLFSRLCGELLLTGVQFKDSRATALTLLARRVDVLTLAKISRHKNLELLRKCYYRETPEDISRRL
jgi:integrase